MADAYLESISIQSDIYNENYLSSLSIQNNDLTFIENYKVNQFGNFYLIKETSPGVWESCNDIDINPELKTETQAVLDSYSGTPGKHVFTAQELVDLADGSGGNIVLYFEETINSGLGITGNDLETNIGKIITRVGLPIWSFIIQ